MNTLWIVAVALALVWALPARAVDCDASYMDEQAMLLCLVDLAKELDSHPERFRIDDDRLLGSDGDRLLENDKICVKLKTEPISADARRIMEALCAGQE